MTGPILATPRLRLRPFEPGDVDALHAHWTRPEVLRYLWDGIAIAREQAAAVVEESLASFAERGYGLWAIELRTGGPLVGFAGLRAMAGEDGVELYYGLDPEHWGHGLATEASREILRYGFDEIGLDATFILADGPNVASVEVMKRLGAHYVRTDATGAFGSTIVYVVRRDG